MRAVRHTWCHLGAAVLSPIVLAGSMCLAAPALAQGVPVPVPSFCPAGQNPLSTPFSDDMENIASGNWGISIIALGGINHWYYPPPPAGIFPASGEKNLWGRDDSNLGDSAIAMTSSFTLPAGARMQFKQYYVFESDGVHHFDGGVIEYSTNGGASWVDAGHLITAGATYGGTLNTNFSNPLGGRSAFVNDSFGYTASQLNLASLAGQSVRFRFRIGTDETLEDSGWFIDDVRIYQCPAGPAGQSTPRDFNGDGRADILWRQTASGTLATWLMNANGTSVMGTGVLGGASSDWTVVDFGDFNGDGRADILWRQTPSGTLATWLMNANGTSVMGTGVLGGASSDWTVVGVADFNGDDRADILWRQTTSGTLAVWLMNASGTGVMGTGVPGGASSDWTVVGVGDFNGDGRADVLWRQAPSGTLAVWLMNANGTSVMGTGVLGGASSDWTVVDVGDFNGDGRADILWRQNPSGTLATWLLNANGTGVMGTGVLGGASSDWTVVRVGDFNGDGRADILWRQAPSGTLAVWLMNANGTSVSSSGSPGGAPPSWVIQ